MNTTPALNFAKRCARITLSITLALIAFGYLLACAYLSR